MSLLHSDHDSGSQIKVPWCTFSHHVLQHGCPQGNCQHRFIVREIQLGRDGESGTKELGNLEVPYYKSKKWVSGITLYWCWYSNTVPTVERDTQALQGITKSVSTTTHFLSLNSPLGMYYCFEIKEIKHSFLFSEYKWLVFKFFIVCIGKWVFHGNYSRF